MCPRTTLASQRPCSGMGWRMRRLSWSLTAFSLARIRFEIVIRFSQNRPFPDFAQMCVKPRKSSSCPCDLAAGSADDLVEGILIGRDGPDFHHLAVAQMHHVHGIGLDAPAAPAGRDDHQRDTVLIVGKDRMKVKVE